MWTPKTQAYPRTAVLCGAVAVVCALACAGDPSSDATPEPVLSAPEPDPAPPVPAPPPDASTPRFSQVEAGGLVYAIQEDGTAYRIPLRVRGTPRAGPSHDLSTMTKLDERFTQISDSASAELACGVTVEGALRCWGDDKDGQVSSAPRQGRFERVEVGSRHACALDSERRVHCWGSSEWGAVGAPTTPVADLTSWAGGSCALGTDGSVACWGANAAPGTLPDPPYTDISLGEASFCALDATGRVACNGFEVCGDSDARVACDPSSSLEGTTAIPGPDIAFQSISLGTYVACGVRRTDGGLSCWGVEQEGSTRPPPGRFVAVSAGVVHACGLREDGALLCWGTIDAEPDEPPH